VKHYQVIILPSAERDIGEAYEWLAVLFLYHGAGLAVKETKEQERTRRTWSKRQKQYRNSLRC
jgi:hypothetical protein